MLFKGSSLVVVFDYLEKGDISGQENSKQPDSGRVTESGCDHGCAPHFKETY